MEPGRRVRAVFYKIKEQLKATVPPVPYSQQGDKAELVVWAAGVVRDEKGQAIKGAAVYD